MQEKERNLQVQLTNACTREDQVLQRLKRVDADLKKTR
jgi:hypothetical protein